MHTPKSPLRLLPLLICLAAILFLATTCGDDEYIYDTGMRVVSVWLTVAGEVGEYRDDSSAKEENRTAADEDGTCETNTSGLVSMMNTSEEEYQKHVHQSVVPAVGALRRHESLFWRQPNVYDVSTGFLRDGKGGWTDTWGITVWVTEEVDQNTLPPEDRIPDHLEGVPVQIVDEEPLPSATETTCDYDTCRISSVEREENMAKTTENTPERRHEVRLKYDPLFWRQPNVHQVGEGSFKDENGEWIETSGIVVSVTKKVDQSTLPPSDRIPDCLEGIPVQVIEEPNTVEIIPEWFPVDTDEEETNGSS